MDGTGTTRVSFIELSHFLSYVESKFNKKMKGHEPIKKTTWEEKGTQRAPLHKHMAINMVICIIKFFTYMKMS